jgi:membrane-associated protein
MDQAIEFFKHLINPQWILEHGGLWLLLFIIFAETGLFVGFFLPGDSLLFVTGMTLSLNNHISGFNVWEVIALVMLAGFLGNFAGYWFGKKSGPLLFKREDSFLFKKRHLIAAHEFYEKYGAGAIVFARFLPFIRTFAPIVAGIVKMEYRKFTIFNFLGCVAWVSSMILIGYFLGKAIPGLEKHLELIVLGIVVITTGPVLIKLLFTKKKRPEIETASSESSSN